MKKRADQGNGIPLRAISIRARDNAQTAEFVAVIDELRERYGSAWQVLRQIARESSTYAAARRRVLRRGSRGMPGRSGERNEHARENV